MENLMLMNRVKWIFRIGAISNFVVTLGGIVNPFGTWKLLPIVQGWLPKALQIGKIPPLEQPAFLIIWCGMAFLWGVVLWEISTDPIKHEDLIKYTYIEKGITTYAITWGLLNHTLPLVLWLFILYTDVLYILLNVYAHVLVRKEMRSPSQAGA
jgi:hypothetical protein